MSIVSVCVLIGLVSSSAMSYSNRLFTDSDALTWSLFSISPLSIRCEVMAQWYLVVSRWYPVVSGGTVVFG